MRASWRLVFPLLLALAGCEKKSAPLDCSILSSLPESVKAAEELRAKGTRWSNTEIRARYVCDAQRIGALDATWKASGLSAEVRAHKAFDVRHDARVTARAMMADSADVKALRARDEAKYGNSDGPTFEWLMKREADKGIAGDAAYEDVIKSAQRTDEDMNRLLLP